jgi:hypothetical protein
MPPSGSVSVPSPCGSRSTAAGTLGGMTAAHEGEPVPALIPGEAQESRFPRLDDLHLPAPRTEPNPVPTSDDPHPEPPGVAELRRIASALEEIAELLKRG